MVSTARRMLPRYLGVSLVVAAGALAIGSITPAVGKQDRQPDHAAQARAEAQARHGDHEMGSQIAKREGRATDQEAARGSNPNAATSETTLAYGAPENRTGVPDNRRGTR